MPILNEFTFKSSNCKNDIYVREWLPENAPVGVIQICHGVAEHMERYDKFAKHLAENGYVVSGNDHLGHGKSMTSDDEKGFFGEHGGWELVVGDVRKLYERLRERYQRLPIFLFGHSMGSFLARTYIIRYHDGLSGVVLSGTGTKSPLLLAVGTTLAKSEINRRGASYNSELLNKIAFNGYNSKVKDKKTEHDWLSNNGESVAAYVADPLCGFVPSAALFRDMCAGIKYISGEKNIRRINKDLPIFLISGTADPTGDYGKGVIHTYNSYMDAGLTDVTLKLYNGARHELTDDFCTDEVLADVLDWVRKKGKQ